MYLSIYLIFICGVFIHHHCKGPKSTFVSHFFLRYEFNVEDGDVIMLATDGIFDNVPDHLLVSEISSKVTEGGDLASSLQQCANSIALIARSLSQDPDFLSPFAKNARANGFAMSGGKEDDITVLLAAVRIGGEK